MRSAATTAYGMARSHVAAGSDASVLITVTRVRESASPTDGPTALAGVEDGGPVDHDRLSQVLAHDLVAVGVGHGQGPGFGVDDVGEPSFVATNASHHRDTRGG